MPDIFETFDAIFNQDLSLIPRGGTPLDDIRDMANSKATSTIGGWVREPGAGAYLEKVKKDFEVHVLRCLCP